MEAKDRSYYKNERPEMLDFIPSKVKRTIEFGCSDGRFSAGVKNVFNTESWGVDINPKAIENAKKVLDKAIQGEAMQVLEKLPKAYFDCVICNDFLEHITDPSDFLIALRPYLKHDAVLISSLPNVRYWRNMKNLIFKKDWEYTSEGILDRTHLRFFTKKSIKRFLKNSGLELEEFKGINPTKSFQFHILNFLTLGLHNDMKYLQFASRARFL